jgi:alpha-beta hydrolase superfamily lysophospholipase
MQFITTVTPWIAAALLVTAALATLLVLLIHLGFRAPRIREQVHPGDLGLRFETVSIPTAAGIRLHGWLLPADSDSSIIILHGWGSNAEQVLPLALPFQHAGINVLLFDAGNHGNSDRRGHASLPRFANDLDHAIDWLRQTHPKACRKLALLGHSVGAGAVLLSASRRQDVDAAIAIAAFAHPQQMMQRYLQGVHVPSPLRRVIIHYVEWVIGHRYDAIAPVNTVCHIQCPILLVHGKADRTVPVADAHAIAQACPAAAIRLLLVDGADHDSVEHIKDQQHALVEFVRDCGLLASPPSRPHSRPPARTR